MKTVIGFYYKLHVFSVPFSHTVFLHRAQAYLQQADYSSALSDAHRAVKLSSKWSKVSFLFAWSS